MRAEFNPREMLLRRGLRLEYATLGWNVIGVVILAITAIKAGSVALAAFGLDSLIEILASTMVIWQLKGTDTSSRTVPALRVIAVAFAGLALYILVQSSIVLATSNHPGRSLAGTIWLAVTALAMFALARGKADTGRRLDNPVLRTEARITVIDGALAAIILLGVLLNTALHWWWADPIAALVLVLYAAREAHHAWQEAATTSAHAATNGPAATSCARHTAEEAAPRSLRRTQPWGATVRLRSEQADMPHPAR